MVCICCGSESPKLFLYKKNAASIYKCIRCGLGHADVTEFDAASYYDESYFNGSRSDGYSDYVAGKEVLHEHFRKELLSLQKYTSANGKLLELGCAYGYFLDVARSSYQEIFGLELCEDAVSNCQLRGLASVKQGMISSTSLAQFPIVDAIVMLDVIEHLPDPREALRVAAEKVRPGGYIFLTTGDFSSIAAKLTGRNWRLMTPPQHLWFFTPASLRLLGDSLGLEVVNVEYPFKKVPLGLIAYQLFRFVNMQPKLPAWLHRHGIMINLFDAMRVVFRKKDL